MDKIGFRVLAMRRSGHHAVLEWIGRHFDKFLHLNDVEVPNVHAHTEITEVCFGNATTEDIDRHNVIVTNYEDIDMNAVLRLPDFGIDHWQNVVVLRDPYNWLASLMCSNNYQTAPYNVLVNKWKKQARSVLNGTQYINYNKWCVNLEYHEHIEKMLDLDHVPVLPKDVRGWVSSFNSVCRNYSERWRFVEARVDYRDMIDSECKSLSKEIFNFNPF